MTETNIIMCGDALGVLQTLPDGCVNMAVTSPPYYGLRDYGVDGQIGLEPTPAEYVSRLAAVFREVRRVLAPDGTLWLNIADSYAGSIPKSWGGVKSKDMLGIPWALAFALRTDGWFLRSDIIWHKTNALPHSVKDRPVSSYEHIFLLAKSKTYYFDYRALEEPTLESSKQRYKRGFGSNKYAEGAPGQTAQTINKPKDRDAPIPDMRRGRDIWSFPTSPLRGIAHFAAYPIELARRCILAGCPEGGIVLDPFFGSGTTGAAALTLGRKYIGIELNPGYIPLARERLRQCEPR
ncbi:MAG: site-specific DNA-methyltransferase [Gracilibacteraceae bacterium]|jgi:DNA modification methylase|nr:site-specific DNA-methyltransferase [Gracilibacteraceae bacterium]